MVLLDPTSALIAAAVCVPALVALYLLKLRRRPVRVSTLLFWTQAAEDLQANVPLRMIRASWLLLLHLLILGMLITALGRPATSGEGAAPARTVIMIDRSASMSAGDGRGGTRLDEAREQALRLIGEATRAGGSAAVVEFALEPRVVAAFTSSRGALADAVRAITPTDQPADLGRALRLADALSAPTDESESFEPPIVHLVSDGGFGPAAVEATSVDLRLVRVGPPEGSPRDNLGFVALAARRDADDPSLVRLFTRVQNAGRAPVVAPITLSLDGQVVERRVVEVPGAGSGSAGELALIFQLGASAGGVAMLTIARPDLLEADNAAAIVLRPPARPRVLLVSPPPGAVGAEDETPADWVLPEVLDQMGLGAVRRARAADAERFLREGTMTDFDLAIFDRVRPSAPPPIPTISFGVDPRAIGIDAAVGEGAGGATYVLTWRRAHPVLRDAPLDTVLVAKAPPVEPGRGVVELARGRSGSLMLLAEGGVKRLAVCFELAESNWPLQVSFPIFLANAAEYMTQSMGEAGRMFTTDELIALSAAPGAVEVELEGPARLRASAPGGTAVLGHAERAGVYTVLGGAERAVAVNLLDARESLLPTGDELSVGGRIVSAGEPVGSRELWPFFVVGAAVLLAVEWLLFAARARV